MRIRSDKFIENSQLHSGTYRYPIIVLLKAICILFLFFPSQASGFGPWKLPSVNLSSSPHSSLPLQLPCSVPSHCLWFLVSLTQPPVWKLLEGSDWMAPSPMVSWTRDTCLLLIHWEIQAKRTRGEKGLLSSGNVNVATFYPFATLQLPLPPPFPLGIPGYFLCL